MKYILTILLMIIIYNQGYACRCIDIKNVKKAYKQSDVVVSITVLEILSPIQSIDTIISKSGDTLISKLVFGYPKRVLINSVYKGENLNDTMLIPGFNSNCELYLQVGKTYIIYGQLQNNQIATSKCTRSGIAENHPDLAYLERKKLRR
ncbi:MAG: hypothetical protein ACXWW0_06535 [Bacteroidia bacterium]